MNTLFTSTDLNRYLSHGEDENMAIIVDGIIGAGKTTVAQLISDKCHIPFFEELQTDSANALTQRMLDRFYADQDRWSAIIQVMFLNQRFRDLKAIEASGKAAILDRSIYGDEIFAKTILERGQMSPDEFRIYQELLHNMLMHIQTPTLLIYLDVTVDTAMERIRQRNRSTEANLIPRDYMVDLHRNYEEWYEAYDLSRKVRFDFNRYAFDDLGEIQKDIQDDLLTIVKSVL